MFTGLVQALGVVASIDTRGDGRRMLVDPKGWGHRAAPGDSIAVNGCCLTVAEAPARHGGMLAFDVVRQTLQLTTVGGLQAGDGVNLEHSVRPDTLMGGHFVQGHIDGTAEVVGVKADPFDWRVRFRPPAALMDVIVPQGSIAVEGVSLTIAAARESEFEVALIPTTLERTTLGRLTEGARVNIETDILARTVVHWLKRQRGG